MSFGQGQITFQGKTASGGGGGVLSMQNGLSLVGTAGELGANPLLHDSVIPLDSHEFLINDGTTNLGLGFFNRGGGAGLILIGDVNEFTPSSTQIQVGIDQVGSEFYVGYPKVNAFTSHTFLSVEPVAGLVQQGDNGALTTGFTSQTDFVNELFSVTENGDAYLNIDKANAVYEIGDIDNSLNGSQFFIDDATKQIVIEDKSGIYLSIDNNSFIYQFGDTSGFNNGTLLSIDDGNRITKIEDQLGIQVYLLLDGSSQSYQIGDVQQTGNGMFLNLNDAAKIAEIKDLAGTYLSINADTREYSFGDVSNSNNDTRINLLDDVARIELNSIFGVNLSLDAINKIYKMGDIDAFGNNSQMQIVDASEGFAFSSISGALFGISPSGIETMDPGSGIGTWKLGNVIAAASVVDVTQYVEVNINGSLVKLATMT
jgi:hypothetical protein